MFDWILTEEFRKFREKFVPTDYSKYLSKQKDKEKVASRKNTPDSSNSNVDSNNGSEVVGGDFSANKKPTPYGCPSCDFTDPDKSKATEHIESEHNNRKVM